MKTFIRVVEYWIPDAGGTRLTFGGGLFGEAAVLADASAGLSFARGEGLPGRAWASGRPIVTPTQDLVIGAFYLTEEVEGAAGEGKVFRHLWEALRAYDEGSDRKSVV